jgi:hypothetical protein
MALQCMLPCIVPLLPKNDPLVNYIRALQCTQMMIGLHCHSDSRLKVLGDYITTYEKASNVSSLANLIIPAWSQYIFYSVGCLAEVRQEL